MYLKRKTIAGKSYAYRMLLSFKTLLTSARTTVSFVKQFSLDITLFFARHCQMSGANIDVCLTSQFFSTVSFHIVKQNFLIIFMKM